MGRGIATCLIAREFHVVAFDPVASQRRSTVRHIEHALSELAHHKAVKASALRNWQDRLTLASSLSELRECSVVFESIPEHLESKQRLFEAIEEVVSPEAILASNTSSIPISLLQTPLLHPGRFVGMHWGEPAQISHYLEVIPGEKTSGSTVRKAVEFAIQCGKEPTELKHDIRGFLSNRLMYAMLREAFHLVESGAADIETIDRSFRNDIGWWATIAGPFRWMDLTGIPAYATVMEGLLPELSNSTEVPALMRKMVHSKALGIQNQKGFYPYTKRTAKQWEERWVEFTYDIAKISTRYMP